MAKDVVHNASALLKVVQPGQQSLHRCLGMLRMQLLHFLIWQFCQGCEELCQVTAHVGVRTVPNCHIRDLSKTLHTQQLTSAINQSTTN